MILNLLMAASVAATIYGTQPPLYCVKSVPQSNIGVHRDTLFCSYIEVEAWGFYVEYTFVRKDEAIFLTDDLGNVYYARSNKAFNWWQH